MSAVELATAYISLVPSMKGAQGTLATELGGAGESAGKSAGSKFGVSMKAAIGAAAIGAAVVASFAGLYKVGSVFDEVNDTIRVGTGASGEVLEGLIDVANRVATSVPTSFGKAGTTVADLNTRLGLSGETLATVASQYIEAGRLLKQDVDIQSTTKAFSAFEIAGDGVIDGMDTLFRISQATGVGINELAAATAGAAPLVKNVGLDFAETASLVGSLDKAGLDANKMFASLGAGLVNLAKSGEPLDETFNRTIGDLDTLIASGDTAAAIDLAAGIFGTRGAAQFVGAVQSGALELDNLVGAVGVTGDTILGLSAETADFAQSWQIVKNNALAALEPVATGVFNLTSNIGAGLASASQTFGPQIAAAFEAVGPFFASLGTTLGPLIGQVVELWQAFSPLSLIFQVISPLLPMLADVFSQLASTIGGSLMTVLQSLMGALKPVITALTGTLSSVLAQLLPIIADLALTMAGVLGSAIEQLAPLVAELAMTLGTVLGTVLEQLAPLLVMIAEFYGQFYAAVVPLIGPILSLVAALMPLLPPIIELVGALLEPLIELLTALLTPILALVTPLVGLLAGALGVVIEVLATLIGWIVEGIVWYVNLVTGSKDAQKGLESVWGAIGDFFNDVWNNIVGFFAQGIVDVMGFVTGLQDQVLGALMGAGQWLVDVGKNIVQGLIDGISGMVKTAVDAVVNLGSSMIEGVQDFLGIRSPSTKARDLVGKPIGQGVVVGLLGEKDAIGDALENIVGIQEMDAFAPIAARDYALADVSAGDGLDDDNSASRGSKPGDGRDDAPVNLSDETIDKLAQAVAKYKRRDDRMGES